MKRLRTIATFSWVMVVLCACGGNTEQRTCEQLVAGECMQLTSDSEGMQVNVDEAAMPSMEIIDRARACASDCQCNRPDCTCGDSLELALGSIADESGDGRLTPGESASVTVSTTLVDGCEHFSYPVVALVAEHEAVEIESDSRECVSGPDTYALNASNPAASFSWTVGVPTSVASGTELAFWVWATSLNTHCTNTPWLRFTAEVK